MTQGASGWATGETAELTALQPPTLPLRPLAQDSYRLSTLILPHVAGGDPGYSARQGIISRSQFLEHHSSRKGPTMLSILKNIPHDSLLSIPNCTESLLIVKLCQKETQAMSYSTNGNLHYSRELSLMLSDDTNGWDGGGE